MKKPKYKEEKEGNLCNILERFLHECIVAKE